MSIECWVYKGRSKSRGWIQLFDSLVAVSSHLCSSQNVSTDFYWIIECISDPEEPEDDVFLEYFTVDVDGNKRPVPAPRRLLSTPSTDGETSGTVESEAVQSLGSRD